jgi:putative hydrolase of the HAD superfamily
VKPPGFRSTPVSHVLFDFFGTLVDYSASRTEQGYEKSFALLRDLGSPLDYAGFLDFWSEVSAQFDRWSEESYREFSMSEVGRAFLERAVPGGHSASDVSRFLASYIDEWNQGVRYQAGVAELLARLSGGFELAIVTNTHDPDLVPGHLEQMGASGHLRQVVTSVEFGLRKPHPAIFRHALDLLGVAAERCLYVGDDPIADYRGARGAGIRALLVDPEGRADVPQRDQVSSVLELERVLADAV